MFNTVVYAAPEAAAAAQGSASLYPVIMMVLMIAVFWFIIIRPQKKKEKELKNMLAALKIGDEVATIGGIHGKIVKIKDDLFVLESGSGNNKSTITVDRGAVSRFMKQAPENKEAEVVETKEKTKE